MTALYRCNQLEGRAVVVEGDPPISVYHDAVYLPGVWGLYDAGRKLITSSGYFRGPDLTPLGLAAFVTDWNDMSLQPAPPGDYYYLGALHEHYGHFLVSTLSRLWAYTANGPRPKLLLANPLRNSLTNNPYMMALFGTLGIEAEDFVWFDKPTRIGTITVAGPSFEETSFVHRAFVKLCARISTVLLKSTKAEPSDKIIYLSKTALSKGVARLINEDVIVAKLQARGVQIVFPEQLSIVEQIRMMTDHRAISGLIGSAFHTSIFVPPKKLLMLNYGGRVTTNQVLIDRAVGHRSVHVFPSAGTTSHVDEFSISHRLRDPVGVADAFSRVIDAFLDGRDAWASSDRPGSAVTGNIAFGRPTSQSSMGIWSVEEDKASDAAGAVSGFLTGSFQFHTDSEASPWWEVDLGTGAVVHEILLYNRIDSAGNRANSFRIESSDNHAEWLEVYRQQGGPAFGGIGGKPFQWRPVEPLRARYIRITLIHLDTYLHLDQVVIRGTREAERKRNWWTTVSSLLSGRTAVTSNSALKG